MSNIPSLPLETIISTAIEKFSDGIITKMNHAEERRNREFVYQLKELEFYKSNYEKDLKNIFDYWFEVVMVTHIKDNEHLTAQEKQRYNKRYTELIRTDTIAKYKMNTLKYGGTETGRILAVLNGLLHDKSEDVPEYTNLFMWCAVLAVLKKDILGQELAPSDVIRVLVTDYDENEDGFEDAKHYAGEYYKRIYGEYPFWGE